MKKFKSVLQKAVSIVLLVLSANESPAQYTYKGQVLSAITQEPSIFGEVRLPSSKGLRGRGKELSKIDQNGYFTFTLEDTSNIQVVLDCSLYGKSIQRLFYSDTITKIFIQNDCLEYNVDRAKKDIEKNEPIFLCYLGYATYYFSSSDSLFEKKYGVKYSSMADTPYWTDCVWLYNSTIAEYLDKKFGTVWRKELRSDVVLRQRSTQ